MQTVRLTGLVLTMLFGLAACNDSSNKPAAPVSVPVHMACTTPEQAGLKAKDVIRKLGEAASAKRISQDDYAAYNATVNSGLLAWGERHDLVAYCAALDKVVKDAALQ